MSAPIVLASRNAGKLDELRPIFRSAGIAVVDLVAAGAPTELPGEADVEAFETFEENALAKARYFHRVLGLACVADDSGLEVLALGGRPGVRSRRWAQDEGVRGADETAANNTTLVRAVRGEPRRSARFVCAAAYSDGVDEFVARGTVRGRIATRPRGAHGFGYDPHFIAAELGKSFAEATPAEKARISHRARAFARLVDRLTAGN